LETDLDRLKSIGQKQQDSILATLVYRKISIRITKILLPTSITPNQVTLFSFALGMASAALFFFGGYWYLLAGAVVLQLHVVFDCVDGEIAKIKGLQSTGGALLDEAVDRAVDIAVFITLAFGIFNTSGSFWIWPIALLCLSGTLTMSLIEFKLDTLKIPMSGSSDLDQTIASSRFGLGWGGGANEFVILVGAAANQMVPALIAIAFFANAHWIARLLLNLRRARKT